MYEINLDFFCEKQNHEEFELYLDSLLFKNQLNKPIFKITHLNNDIFLNFIEYFIYKTNIIEKENVAYIIFQKKYKWNINRSHFSNKNNILHIIFKLINSREIHFIIKLLQITKINSQLLFQTNLDAMTPFEYLISPIFDPHIQCNLDFPVLIQFILNKYAKIKHFNQFLLNLLKLSWNYSIKKLLQQNYYYFVLKNDCNSYFKFLSKSGQIYLKQRIINSRCGYNK